MSLIYSVVRLLLDPSLIGLMWLQDEICRSIADKGGVDAVLRCIDDSGEQLNKSVARTCCSLLAKVCNYSLCSTQQMIFDKY